MKFMLPAALAMIGLALTPSGVTAKDDGADAASVSYDDAMKCSALFGLLAGSVDGEDEAILQDAAARWLLAAMGRDGTSDGSTAQGELEGMVEALIMALDEAPDEATAEEFLNEGITFCEGKQLAIADEMGAIAF
jgi:hypothetical protein